MKFFRFLGQWIKICLIEREFNYENESYGWLENKFSSYNFIQQFNLITCVTKSLDFDWSKIVSIFGTKK